MYIYIHIQLTWNSGISKVGSYLSLFELTGVENQFHFTKSVLVWRLQVNVVTYPANQNQRFTPERRMDQRPQQLNLLGLSLGQEPVARNMAARTGHWCLKYGRVQPKMNVYLQCIYIYIYNYIYIHNTSICIYMYIYWMEYNIYIYQYIYIYLAKF